MATAVATRGTAPEGRNRLLVIGALVFGLITAVLLFVALQNNDDGDSAVQVTTRDVVVVSRDVSANTILTEDMLSVEAVPADQVLGNAYAVTNLAVGLPARYPLQAGEQVTSAKVGLDEITEEDDLALVLPPGMRAFAVEASEISAVGGNLLPGNVVDVIAVFGGEEFGGFTRSETVLQDIAVLSIAQEALQPVPASSSATDETEDGAETGTGIEGQRDDEVERQPDAQSVTLAVDLNQAQQLAVLQSQDDVQIWLALRRPGDPVVDDPQPATLGSFFDPPQN